MLLLRKVEIVARDIPQDHLLYPVEIDKVIVKGDPYALDQGFGRVFLKEVVESTHGANGSSAVMLLESVDHAIQHCVLSTQIGFLWGRRSLVPPRTLDPMGRVGGALLAAWGQLGMDANQEVAVEDSDLVDRFAEAYSPTDADAFRRDRVAVGMEVDIAFDVHAALMHVVDLRYVVRERSQGRLLSDPKGPRRSAQMFPKLEIGAITPGAELSVAVVEVVEGTPWVEVVLDVVEGPLDSSGAIRIPHRVRLEAEVESLGKGPHHRGRDGVPAPPVSDDHRAVVDHAARGAPSEVLQGFAQKGAAFKAGPARIDLGVEKPAVTEDETCALEPTLRLTQQNGMGGGVVLHLFSGFKMILPGRDAGLDAYPFPSAEVCQRGVRDFELVARLELLSDPGEVVATFLMERSDDLDVLVELGLAMD